MNKERDPYKEEAQMALAKGDWKRALENYQKHCDQEPEDLRSCVKIGELLERLGRKKEAVLVYREVADAYAKDGFLLRAISLNKMILRIDPSAGEINDRLAQLYQERIQETRPFRSLPPIPLFSPLSPEDREEVLKRFRPQKVPENTFIFREGDPSTSLYLVKSGEVEIFAQDRHGKKVMIAAVRSGNFFGETGPLLHRPRMAHAKTKQPTEILELTKDDLDLLLHRFPSLRLVLKELSLERLARMKELLSRDAVEKAREVMV